MIKESGLAMVKGSKMIFLVTDRVNVTKKVTQIFIEEVCEISESLDKSVAEIAIKDESTINAFKQSIHKATLEEKENHYCIKGLNYVQNIPKSEAEKCLVVIFEWEE